MHNIKGQILLNEEEIVLIKKASSEGQLDQGTIFLKELNFKNHHINLELWVTDDGTHTPYLTLSVYENLDDYKVFEEDISFDNVNWIFKTFTIEISDITYIIEIAKEDELLCNTTKIVGNDEDNIESLNEMISQYKSTIKEKDVQIESLEEKVSILERMLEIKDDTIKNNEAQIDKLEKRLTAVHNMNGKINKAIKEFEDKISKY